MDTNLQQELLDTMRDLIRALDANTASHAAAAHQSSGPVKAGAKPGQHSMPAVQVQTLAREYPNDYGWFKAKLGSRTRSEWFDTKSKSIADLVQRAAENDLTMAITYDEKRNGDYTNRYLKTVEIVEGNPDADDDGGDPPQQKRRSSPRQASKPAAPEEPLEEAPF